MLPPLSLKTNGAVIYVKNKNDRMAVEKGTKGGLFKCLFANLINELVRVGIGISIYVSNCDVLFLYAAFAK